MSLRSRHAAVAALVILSACRSSDKAAEPSAPAPTNVLIILLDACRADRFGVYGFARDTTPRIDAFAHDPDATVFRNHYAQGSWTKPSVASLFSGLLVREHGVTLWTDKQTDDPRRAFRTHMLAAKIDTLAERFHAAGYATFAVINNNLLAPGYGYEQGFDQYDAPESGRGDSPADVERTVAPLKSPGRHFGYLHLMGCHAPHPARHRDSIYMTKYGHPYDEPTRQQAGVDFSRAAAPLLRALKQGTVTLTDDDVAFMQLVYEAQLRWLDGNVVGPLLSALQQAGVYDDTLIIITADHGDELYEHKGYTHGHALWEGVLHVPLIVKFPKGHRPAALAHDVSATTSSVDILPALLALIGQPAQPGRSGEAIFSGKFSDRAFAEMGYTWEWALIEKGYKLIETHAGPKLYNLADDAEENRNLAVVDVARLNTLRATANKLMVGAPPMSAPVVEKQLDPAVRESMRNLGYGN